MRFLRTTRYNASMTAKGHRVTAFMILLAATGSALAAACGLLGGVFPDTAEYLIWGGDRGRHHRKWTHWFALYLAGFGLCFYLWGNGTLPPFVAVAAREPAALWSCAAFWFAGGLLHILCDACCGKVPLWDPRKKNFGIKVFTMAKARGEMSSGEGVFVGFVALSCASVWLRRFIY